MQTLSQEKGCDRYKRNFDMELTDEIFFSKNDILGEGAFGSVYLGKNIKTGEGLAIKIDKKKNTNSQIAQEKKIYQQLESKSYVIAMELLGINLNKLMKRYLQFSAYTTSTIGIQMLDRLHSLHSCNYVYRDVKPDNFLIGKEKKESNKIYLIDFGLSKRFRDSRTGLHIPYRDGKNLTGTARYASINTHLGMEQSRRDDIEALAYLLIYFMRGNLPWQNMPGFNIKDKSSKIGQMKMDTKLSELCQGCPKEMEKFVQRARNLRFDEKPNYDYFKKQLNIIRERELNERKEECVLEWEKGEDL